MCIACNTTPDPEAMDAFGEKFLGYLNGGVTAMMISIGDRTGLFEAMKDGVPRNAPQIAERTNLSERYVREWLGGVTVAGIVECDEQGQLFHLPPAHAVLLTRNEQADSLAHLSQYISILGAVEDQVVECFEQGGGVPYAAYPRFHEVMAKDSRQTIVDALEQHVLPLVPGMTDRLHAGVDVLDVGCGRGLALCRMAELFPQSRFVGYDFSREAVDFATANAAANGLENIRFEVRDLSGFDEDAPSEAFEFVTAFDAIHDQIRPDRVLKGIRNTLRPGGTFLMQDIQASSNVAENRDHVLGPLLYGLSLMHCMTVSLSAGGTGLGAMWGEGLAREYLQNAGFPEVEVNTLDHDPQNYYYVTHKTV